MFFEEHEKQIYTPPGSDRAYDPLAIDRALTVATGGNLPGLVADWKAGSDGQGDVSDGAAARDAVTSAKAEEVLAAASRAAFGLPAFPQCTDGVALEYLADYLTYMAGKGRRESRPPPSPSSSPGV